MKIINSSNDISMSFIDRQLWILRFDIFIFVFIF